LPENSLVLTQCRSQLRSFWAHKKLFAGRSHLCKSGRRPCPGDSSPPPDHDSRRTVRFRQCQSQQPGCCSAGELSRLALTSLVVGDVKHGLMMVSKTAQGHKAFGPKEHPLTSRTAIQDETGQPKYERLAQQGVGRPRFIGSQQGQTRPIPRSFPCGTTCVLFGRRGPTIRRQFLSAVGSMYYYLRNFVYRLHRPTPAINRGNDFYD
jgi:hypothetical protein